MEEIKDIVEETTAFEAAEVVEMDAGVEEFEIGGDTSEVTPVGDPDDMPVVDTQEDEFDKSETVNNAPPPDLSQVGGRMDEEARWYVLHTFSGYESVAEDNLKKVVEKFRLGDRILEIFIPTEDTIVEKRDKKVLVPSKTMPSYIFIKMVYGDDLWHTITRTRGITGFVGPKGRPLPLSNKEVIAMRLERKPNLNVKVEVGDIVTVVEGPLSGQSATITAIDSATGKLAATVNMFGRPTPVDLYLQQVKK